MEPLQEIIKIALIGAGANQAVSGVVALGKSTLSPVWQHLSANGKRKVESNLKNFGERLSAEVQRRMEAGYLTQEQLAAVLDQPETVDVLLQALTHAAKTESVDKHVLLAKIVAERLTAEPESELALVSRMALDATANLNARHLKILALCYLFATQRYEGENVDASADGDDVRLREVEWVVRTFTPYQDVEASPHDAEHLEAVGCIGGPKGFLVADFQSALRDMVSSDLDHNMVMKTTTGQHLKIVWDNAILAGLVLTSVGSLIGMYTADSLANRPTDVVRWLRRS